MVCGGWGTMSMSDSSSSRNDTSYFISLLVVDDTMSYYIEVRRV